jgi:hypothetical protein
MIPTRSQSSSKKRNDHVLSGPSKTWRPALQSLIRRPPNNNVQRPRLERSRSRKFLFTNAWKRQVCHIAALLESVCRIRHHCAMCWPLHKSVSLATTGHSSQADIHQGLHSIGDQYPGHTTNDIFGISSQTILDLFHIENVGWPQIPIGKCLYSPLSPIIESETHTLARALPASLNGLRIVTTPRQKSLYGYTNVSSRSFRQNSATGCADDDNLKMMYAFAILQAPYSTKSERIFFGIMFLYTSCRTWL